MSLTSPSLRFYDHLKASISPRLFFGFQYLPFKLIQVVSEGIHSCRYINFHLFFPYVISFCVGWSGKLSKTPPLGASEFAVGFLRIRLRALDSYTLPATGLQRSLVCLWAKNTVRIGIAKRYNLAIKENWPTPPP